MPLTLRRRGKVWHYSGTVAGRRLRGSTGTSDKEIAQRIAAETEAREWKRHLDGPGADLTMAHAFLLYREADKSDRFLVPLEDHFKNTLVRDVTGEIIRQVARKLYPGLSPATLNRQAIVPCAAAINHAADLGLCPHIKVKRFPVNPKRKEAATREWVMAFATQATKDGLIHLAALCMFMFATAARIGEACALTWADVDLSNAQVTIRMGKPTPWQRTADLPAPVVAALANIPSNRNPDDLVFQYAGRESVDKVWRNVRKRAGIKLLTPHCCRHGFATSMLRAGKDVKTVAELGGWKDASVLLRTYAHATKTRHQNDVLFGTNPAQAQPVSNTTIGKEKGK